MSISTRLSANQRALHAYMSTMSSLNINIIVRRTLRLMSRPSTLALSYAYNINVRLYLCFESFVVSQELFVFFSQQSQLSNKELGVSKLPILHPFSFLVILSIPVTEQTITNQDTTNLVPCKTQDVQAESEIIVPCSA